MELYFPCNLNAKVFIMNTLQKFRALPFVSFLRKDGRHPQIVFQLAILLFGLFALGWDTSIFNFFVAISACLFFQAVAAYIWKKPMDSLKSALISSLSLCLMFKANYAWTIVLCAGLTIFSKFLIRYKGKHFFNPTNFGIMVTMLLTQDGWVSPGQWGSNTVLMILICIGGLSVLFNVGRLDSSLAFLGAFSGLTFIRTVLYQGWELDHFYHHLSSGTLLLFAFFMITDPVTTPNSRKGRIIWAALVGAASFVLTSWHYVYIAPLWALFFIAPTTVLLDKVFKHERFTWKPTVQASGAA